MDILNQEKEKNLIEVDKQIEKAEKIRPELNLEKLPIFLPSHSRKTERFKTRIIKRKNSEITISPHSIYGILTTKDKDVLYSIYQLWEDFGRRPDGFCPLSRLKIAKTLGIKPTGTTLKSLSESLLRLSLCGFIFKGYFYNSQTKETYEILETFHILNRIKLIRKTKKKKEKPETREEVGYCQINPLITQNILNNHSKPLYFKTYIKLKNEITKLLYSYLDLIMADKTYYERRTENLFFEDLELKGKTYNFVSIRVRILQEVIKELRGIELSTGIISYIETEKTEDSKDYKLVVKKTPFKKKIKQPTDQTNLLEIQQPPPQLPTQDQTKQPFKSWAQTFQPQNYQEEQALNIAKEFNNLEDLGYYLKIFEQGPEAAIQLALEEVRNAKDIKSKPALFRHQYEKYKKHFSQSQ